ncbi:bifunctional UDP-N-acetylglucosamine pyrophosphorylase / Glucosamine-1-phosphate N-acetyltransferase [Micromonospora pattaloongensis]|uniref:Bifunctional protein GlmU n=1 Tax=Micromonospora pattaloongensis TaxID=405436 RepID=A0A1H3GII5_9ACTN|nr:bifunctional UDP-N-acetylglucosamine diphosphorylase/glucosamine-1-phosphate N-acetyltransferase GlmU [Micromonospora pattaloongensis]SDY03101.1 bifunctional UDP-N-acetylglucosamine pyrophosphorylase / Glucosamine-1-phosphate N-acetyltransferase [Micromonospora pattaloongensis]
MTQAPPRTVVVLAAGEGKRMKSALPKVLHPLLGRTLVGHVLAAAAPVGAARTLVVVGHGADQVTAHLAEIAPAATPVLQAQQHGTGHAVRIALEAAPESEGTVIVLNGDVPLLRAETVTALVEAHERAGAAATVLAAEVADPTGLGRIVRDPAGGLERIVEERDASADERRIREINAGIYAFDAARLRGALGKLSTDNDQGEEYLTDVFGLLAADGQAVAVHVAADANETLGCNDRVELAGLRRLLRDRINEGWMRTGVTIADPMTTWIDVTVTLGRDAVIDQNTQLRGATAVAEGATVGPDVTLVDTTVGVGATVLRSHATGAEVGDGASVGPYAYLRPGSRLARKAKVGTFVETKNAEIGEGTKVPHLSYVGDATIGEQSNIGAATVFVNYDGINKHRTVIGSHARTGADNMFVAPVQVGDGAYTAAGSVIVSDVPPGALGVARGQQRNIEGWVARRRPGSAAAEAAERALQAGTALPADQPPADASTSESETVHDRGRAGGVGEGARDTRNA